MEKYWIEIEFIGQYGEVNSQVVFDDIENHLHSSEIENLIEVVIDHNCSNEHREVNWYRLCSNGTKEKVAHLDDVLLVIKE